jgi:hypothetical protein
MPQFDFIFNPRRHFIPKKIQTFNCILNFSHRKSRFKPLIQNKIFSPTLTNPTFRHKTYILPNKIQLYPMCLCLGMLSRLRLNTHARAGYLAAPRYAAACRMMTTATRRQH